ncbi:MAG: Do family serine endopeptidase [Desulfobacteraceae bacterium]|nr:MAG: Do family serine endopeptidase [Desulfobacteraceae bacterium]
MIPNIRFFVIILTILSFSVPLGPIAAWSQNGEVPMVPANFTQLAESARPGVVNIRTERTMKGGGRVFKHFFGDPFGGGGRRHPFEEFFGPFSEPPQEFKQQSLGSGFLIDKEGYIVTNNHVIEGADQIKVRLANEKEYQATVVGRDPKTDLALIKVEGAKELNPLPLGDSEILKVGTWVVAIGSPFGLEQTVTQGIVSAKKRVIGAGPYDDFIQTDASINPGNSGGPLLDLQGRVVGINTAIVASGQGIGFAIPINMAKAIVAQLKEKGEVTRGWLGVGIQDLTPELAEYYGLANRHGVLVTQVFEGDPAHKAGVQRYDIITALNGQSVSTGRELSAVIANTPVGEKTKITVMRGTNELNLTATVVKRDDDQQRAGGAVPKPSDALGLQVAEMSPERSQQFGLDKDESGVLVVDVEKGSRADKAGVRMGDLIKGINKKKVENLKDYETLMKSVDKKEALSMLIARRNEGLKAIKITP